MNSNLERSDSAGSCEFEENLSILRQIDFFSGLPLEAIKVFAYLCHREHFRPGEYLFQQDEEDGRAYYFVSGNARLVQQVDGNEVEVRDYGEGDFIGRLALMGKMRRLFSLRAATEVGCLTLSQEKFTKALEQFPEQMPKMIRVIVEGIYKWEKRFIRQRTGDCDDCTRKIGVSLV
jgi:CRP/FNR family cyclic AMP-dependent transcriptional regulator